jgi:hypothetical protein
MKPRVPQVNFSKGEIGPQLYGRFDVDTWGSALKQARNVIILKYGGLTKRPGHRLVAEVLDPSAPVRIIPFEFSDEQTYALELGQGYMAPIALGGRVLDTELAITDITSADNAKITAALHAYTVGKWVFLQGIAGNMGARLNGRFWKVTGVEDANNFTINASTTGLLFTSAVGGITRVAPPPPPPPPPVVTPPPPAPDPPPTSPPDGGRPLGPEFLL